MNSCFVKAFLLVGMPFRQTLRRNPNNGIGYRSTMRGRGVVPDLRGMEERTEADGGARERIGAAFVAVDDANHGRYDQSGLPEHLDGLERGAAGGDDVLDQADALSWLEDSLDPVAGAVLLDGAADDHERQLALE